MLNAEARNEYEQAYRVQHIYFIFGIVVRFEYKNYESADVFHMNCRFTW